MRKSLFQDLGMEGETIENKRILKKDLSKKKNKKNKNLTRQNASGNFSVIRLRFVLGFGNTELLVTFAGMISVKPDCLKWLDMITMGLIIFSPQKKAWLRKKEDKDRNSYKELKRKGKNVFKI